MAGYGLREATAADLAAMPDRFAARELGDAPDGFVGVVVEHGGRCVGGRFAKVLPMVVRGETLRFGVLAGCWLEPDFRSGGRHGAPIELDEAFAEAFEGRDRMPCVVGRFCESDWWTLRARRDFAPVRTEVDYRVAGAPARRGSSDRAVPADDAVFDSWTAPLLAGPTSVRRDGRLLRARARLHASTCASPAAGPWCVLRNGAPVGWALFAPAENGGLDVLDWCVPEGDDAAAAALLDVLADAAAPSVTFPVFSRSPWLHFLQRAGFRASPSRWGGLGEPYLAVRATHPRCDADALAELWHATAADVCRYPMEPTFATTSAVTSAPWGVERGADRHA